MLPLPQSAAASRPWWITAGLLVAVLAVVHGVVWLQPSFFEPLAARVTDRLLALRAKLSWLRPAYDDTVFHVVVDDASVRELADFYLGRDDHARLVRNLARTKVAAQFHDVIFAAPQSEREDAELAAATAKAKNVYYGFGAGISFGDRFEAAAPLPGDAATLDRNRWHLTVRGDAGSVPEARRPFVTFPALAEPARGIGFLDASPDRDGVYRRVPLLVRHGDGFLPSLSLRVACDYLGVSPERIEVEPGRRILLRGARRPGSVEPHDVAIPIDARGQTVVNYLGPWNTMTNVPFSVVYRASDDRFTMEDLAEVLRGKIAVVSWFATGAEDVGATPVDTMFPRAGIHATVIHSILTGGFLRETTGWQVLAWVELPLLVLLFVGAMWLSTGRFVAAAAGAAIAYAVVVVVAFFGASLILDLPTPLFFVVAGTAVVAGLGFHEQSKARARLDRELAVARDIQRGTFPKKMPSLAGYELAGTSEPAEETGGDSYDVIALGDRRVVLLIGDATGHGVGPALSVTQTRSMLRVAMRLGADLDTTLREINDQLAQDLASNRFVTAFLGQLDTETHSLVYHAAGQGPILHFRAGEDAIDWHPSTAMPMGMMEQLVPPKAVTLTLGVGDVVALITDGIYEYEDASEEQFGRERVAEVVRKTRNEPVDVMLRAILDELRRFARSAPQADDMTLLLVKRLSA